MNCRYDCFAFSSHVPVNIRYKNYPLFERYLKRIVTNVCSYFYAFKAYRKTSMTFCAIKESRPDVGSSQNIKGGLVKTSAAKESRFISPPDIPLIVF